MACLGGNHVFHAPLPPLLLSLGSRIWETKARKGGTRQGCQEMESSGSSSSEWNTGRVLIPGTPSFLRAGDVREGHGKAAHGMYVFRALCPQRSLQASEHLIPARLPYCDKHAIVQPSLTPFQSCNKPASGFSLSLLETVCWLMVIKGFYRKVSK